MNNMTGDMGIYLHIPFCKQKCSYCDFPSYQGLEAYYEPYVAALCREIALWAAKYPESTDYPVDTIYFGGGTPTRLRVEQLSQILDTVHRYFTVLPKRELSIEANPGEIDKAYLKGLRALGVTRLSYGVQTFDDVALKVLRRSHTGAQALKAIAEAVEVGFPSMSLDLIYALPGQSLKDLEKNLNIVKGLPINHLSIYGLQLEGGTYLEKQVNLSQVTLPADDEAEAMYDYMLEALQRQGFERYEISNFAKQGAYSRHNLRYWQYKDYLGFGAGAHSFVGGIRRANEKYVVPYVQQIGKGNLPVVAREEIDDIRHREDFCFLALRTKWGLQEKTYQALFHHTLREQYGEVLQDLLAKDLLIFREGAYVLTPLGAKHGNYVFARFID